MRELERKNTLLALEMAQWRVSGPSGAAKLLGVKPTTLTDRMKKLKLVKPSARARQCGGARLWPTIKGLRRLAELWYTLCQTRRRTGRWTGQPTPTPRLHRVSLRAAFCRSCPHPDRRWADQAAAGERLRAASRRPRRGGVSGGACGAISRELQAALSRIAPVGNESRVRASVQKMSPDEAAGHAATIVKLYVELMTASSGPSP